MDTRKFYFPPGMDSGPDILAVGIGVDNCICLASGNRMLLSRSLGNLENPRSLDRFKIEIDRLQQITGSAPSIVVHDMDPDCLAARYARQIENARQVPLQRHFALVAGCMAEHGETEPVLAVVFDDPGKGEDGAIWGAEFLLTAPGGFRRLGHMRHIRWPGGMRAAGNPWRIAMAFIHLSYGYQTQDIARELFRDIPKQKRDFVFEMLEKGLRSPSGTSMKALFDALSAISDASGPDSAGGRAALSVEQAAQRVQDGAQSDPYPYDIVDNGSLILVDPAQLIYEAVENSLAKKPLEEIAARFLLTVENFTLEVCAHLKERTGVDRIVLAGSVFQNRYLLGRVIEGLKKQDFKILTRGVVPPGGPGISLGQAYAVRARETGFTLNEQ